MSENLAVMLLNELPIASIITLTYKNSMIYKYGCPHARFHNLGGMPYLFWKAIQDAKQNGAVEFDLGRSDCDNESLAAFKEHLAGRRSLMTYWTHPAVSSSGFVTDWKVQLSKRLFRWMPNRLLGTTGKILYKHMG